MVLDFGRVVYLTCQADLACARADAAFYGFAVTASVNVDDPKRPVHNTPTVRVAQPGAAFDQSEVHE